MSKFYPKSDNVKTRTWCFLVYEDSAPPFWQDILHDLAVPFLISPRHDKDVYDEKDIIENPNLVLGDLKKPHYHVIIDFDNTKTIKQAQEISDLLSGVKVRHVISKKGMARYLCHLDNPDKYQYDVNDVTSCCIDYIELISIKTDKYWLIRELLQFVDDNNIYSYHVLVRHCLRNNESWFRSLCDNSTFIIKEYLKSKYWELKKIDN